MSTDKRKRENPSTIQKELNRYKKESINKPALITPPFSCSNTDTASHNSNRTIECCNRLIGSPCKTFCKIPEEEVKMPVQNGKTIKLPPNKTNEEKTMTISEKRRLQVKEASNRFRKRQKEELTFLRKRIAELEKEVDILHAMTPEKPSEVVGWQNVASKFLKRATMLRKRNIYLRRTVLSYISWSKRLSNIASEISTLDIDEDDEIGYEEHMKKFIPIERNPSIGDSVRSAFRNIAALKQEIVAVAATQIPTFSDGWEIYCYVTKSKFWIHCSKRFQSVSPMDVGKKIWEVSRNGNMQKLLNPNIIRHEVMEILDHETVVIYQAEAFPSPFLGRSTLAVHAQNKDGNRLVHVVQSIGKNEATDCELVQAEILAGVTVEKFSQTSTVELAFYYDVKGFLPSAITRCLISNYCRKLKVWEEMHIHSRGSIKEK